MHSVAPVGLQGEEEIDERKNTYLLLDLPVYNFSAAPSCLFSFSLSLLSFSTEQLYIAALWFLPPLQLLLFALGQLLLEAGVLMHGVRHPADLVLVSVELD